MTNTLKNILTFNYWVYNTLYDYKKWKIQQLWNIQTSVSPKRVMFSAGHLCCLVAFTPQKALGLWQKGDPTSQEPLQLFLFSCRWSILGCQWLQNRFRLPQAHSEPGLPHQCQENWCSGSWPRYQENLFLCWQQVLEVRFFFSVQEIIKIAFKIKWYEYLYRKFMSSFCQPSQPLKAETQLLRSFHRTKALTPEHSLTLSRLWLRGKWALFIH